MGNFAEQLWGLPRSLIKDSYVLFMRCLVMAARGAPIAILLTVLADQGLEVVSSADLGAGASLGAADLGDINCAVAVLPQTSSDGLSVAPGLAAILVEIGVALGRDIPTLAVTDPDSWPAPALATMPQAAVRLDDHDTLRLHVGLFAKTVIPAREPVPRLADANSPDISMDAASVRGRLDEVLMRSGPASALAFERFVVDLLSDAGGQVETKVRAEDDGIDAVIGLGGPNRTPLVVLVEIKRLRHPAIGLPKAADQLLRYLTIRRADLGLIIVDQPISEAARSSLPPLILALSADELVDQLTREPLDLILRRARNRAVHGV